MLYRIKAKVSDTHHHMDPLPRFLFLVFSASDAYTAIESTASNIQDLIFQRVCLDLYGVSKEKKKKIFRSSLSHRDLEASTVHQLYH